LYWRELSCLDNDDSYCNSETLKPKEICSAEEITAVPVVDSSKVD